MKTKNAGMLFLIFIFLVVVLVGQKACAQKQWRDASFIIDKGPSGIYDSSLNSWTRKDAMYYNEIEEEDSCLVIYSVREVIGKKGQYLYSECLSYTKICYDQMERFLMEIRSRKRNLIQNN